MGEEIKADDNLLFDVYDAYLAYEGLLIRHFLGYVDKRKMKRYYRRLVKAYRKCVKEGLVKC